MRPGSGQSMQKAPRLGNGESSGADGVVRTDGRAVERTKGEWRLDSGSIFTGFGAGAQAAVSVRDFAKLFPLTVQSRIGFEPPFDCPRFVPSRSIGYFVGRQDAEQC